MEQKGGRAVDQLDYAILKAVSQADIPLWKKRIFQRLTQEEIVFPGWEDISEQTIGRRVDTLADSGVLDTAIISTKKMDIDRGHMIGYKLTEEGEKTLHDKRGQMLKNQVASASNAIVTGEFDKIDISKVMTLDLMKDEFDIDIDETLQEELTVEELVVTLASYYSNRNVSEHITDDGIKRIARLVEKNPELYETILEISLVERIRQQLGRDDDGVPATAEA